MLPELWPLMGISMWKCFPTKVKTTVNKSEIIFSLVLLNKKSFLNRWIINLFCRDSFTSERWLEGKSFLPAAI